MDNRQELTKVLAMSRRRCRDKALLAMIEAALRHPNLISAKSTKSGVRLVGPTGSPSTHFTNSDYRASRNFRSALRRAGLYP